MKAYRTTRRAGRMAWYAICAVGLNGVVGCQDSATGPTAEPGPMTNTDVVILVTDEPADAGEQVEVILQFPETDRSADLVFHVTLTWDPASFDYVDAPPLRYWKVLDIDLEGGWVRLQVSDPDSLEDDRITLIFVALRDADMSGFAADALIRPKLFEG